MTTRDVGHRQAIFSKFADGASYVGWLLAAMAVGSLLLVIASRVNDDVTPAVPAVWSAWVTTIGRGLPWTLGAGAVLGFPLVSLLLDRRVPPLAIWLICSVAGATVGFLGLVLLGLLAAPDQVIFAALYVTFAGLWCASLGTAIYLAVRRSRAAGIGAGLVVVLLAIGGRLFI